MDEITGDELPDQTEPHHQTDTPPASEPSENTGKQDNDKEEVCVVPTRAQQKGGGRVMRKTTSTPQKNRQGGARPRGLPPRRCR